MPRQETKPWMGLAYAWAAILVATFAYVTVLAPRAAPRERPVCGATRTFLQGMSQKMFVDVYAAPVDDETAAAARHMEGLMTRYREAAGGKLSYDLFHGADDATRGRAAAEHVYPEPYVTKSGERKPVLLGIAFTYAGEHDVIDFVPPSQADTLELWATQKMEQLVRRVEGPKVRVGVLVGHGEPRLGAPDLLPGGADTMSGILTRSFPFIELVETELSEDRPVDPSLDGLLVLQPAEDLEDGELARIDDFVMLGKSLAVFASAVNVKPADPTMAATITTHGLSKLTRGYGMAVDDDVVFDFGQFYESPGDKRPFSDMPFVVELDPTFLPFAPLQAIVFPFASSIQVSASAQPEARVREVAATTHHASQQAAKTVSLDPEKDLPQYDGKDRFVVAAAAEGTVRSALHPEKKSARPARVFVAASSAMLENPFLRAGETEKNHALGAAYARALVTPLVLFLESTVWWMATSDAELACDEEILRK